MKIGKLPEPVLIRSVLKQVKHRREEVLVGPAVGQDCAALEVGEDEVLVMSTDPITGTAKDLGHHSIHITANDLAAAGADPVGVMLTVMLPDTVEEPEIRKMMQDADSLNLVRLVVLKTAHFPAMLYIPGNDTLPVAVYAFILQKSTLAALTVLFHLSPVLQSERRQS